MHYITRSITYSYDDEAKCGGDGLEFRDRCHHIEDDDLTNYMSLRAKRGNLDVERRDRHVALRAPRDDNKSTNPTVYCDHRLRTS